jgi:hypothetical protein
MLLLIGGVFVFAAGCSASSSRLSSASGEVVYGNDDRLDYFELTEDAARSTVAGSMVALVSNATIEATGGDLGKAPTWGQYDNLCSSEPFASQPAAAFCSGVLVDWDLVLTADHCTRIYPLDEFKIVFDYYYSRPGQLATGPDDFAEVAEIVNEELDPEGTTPLLDYAWLRLKRPAGPPHQPVAVTVAAPALELGSPVASVGTPGGIPTKWDSGGTVRNARMDTLDYFVADADNSAGSSGGGAFDSSGTLMGITARGGTDFVPTDAGCNTTVYQPDGSAADEQFTYAFRAVSQLCATGTSASSLCRPDCGNPCLALPPLPGSSGGCSVTDAPLPAGPVSGLPLVSGVVVAVRRRSRRPTCQRLS